MKKHITAEDLIKAQGTISCQKELKEKLMLTETLEEAAEKLTNDFPALEVRFNMTNEEIYGWFLEALQKGAKWQEQNSDKKWSEEDMRICWEQSQENLKGVFSKYSFNEWFEQFKKK